MIKRPAKLNQERKILGFQIGRLGLVWEPMDNLAKRRLLIVCAMGILLTLIEMIDHYEPGNPNFFKPEFWHRLPIYAVLLPLITWILLELLERNERARKEVDHEMARQTALSQTLLGSAHWNDLVEAIIQFPGAIAPVNSTALFLYSDEESAFRPAGTWHAPGSPAPDVTAIPSPETCVACPSTQSLPNGGVTLCPITNSLRAPGSSLQYCATLINQDGLTGVLRMDLPADSALTDHQRKLLNRTLPEIVQALANARLQESPASPADATLAERRQIAQDLHDTLAQNVGFLRLKLNQFAADGTLMGIAEIRHDIEHMLDAANEAYEQIRGTLASLNVAEQGQLISLLRDRARLVGDRAGFDIRVVSLGQPQPLTSKVHHQVFNIAREALNNVEKHARAQTALIQLAWERKALKVEIEDDGVGFDPESVQAVDHLGLSIMCQRARAIKGKVSITSAPGCGTRVVLWLPI